MRDKNRIPIIMQKLQELWLLYPDLRFGQVVCMLAKDINYDEDDIWLNSINTAIKKTGVNANINNIIKVKLTPEGLNILVEHIKTKDIKPYKDIDEFLNKHYKFNPVSMETELQLYEFFGIFNKQMNLLKELPFDTNIKIFKE